MELFIKCEHLFSEECTCSLDKNYLLRALFFSFLAHCDHEELLLEEAAEDQEIDIASAENEVLINKTEKKNNKKVKHDSRSSRAHRILMNLDDKNRFTDEITV